MQKNDFTQLIKNINRNQNANNIAEVDSIFTDLKERNLTRELIAFVFANEKPSYFLLRTQKHSK